MTRRDEIFENCLTSIKGATGLYVAKTDCLPPYCVLLFDNPGEGPPYGEMEVPIVRCETKTDVVQMIQEAAKMVDAWGLVLVNESFIKEGPKEYADNYNPGDMSKDPEASECVCICAEFGRDKATHIARIAEGRKLGEWEEMKSGAGVMVGLLPGAKGN